MYKLLIADRTDQSFSQQHLVIIIFNSIFKFNHNSGTTAQLSLI